MKQAGRHRLVLAVFGSADEMAALEAIIVRTGLVVRHASTVDEAVSVLSQTSAAVVFSGSQFADGQTWRDVLARLQELPHPPPLIVADRCADEALWAEALNLGAYDLLMQPFDPEEVTRIIELAKWSGVSRTTGNVP